MSNNRSSARISGSRRWTNGRAGGFFVEIGAYDGVDISNTFLLERSLGWKGILVEPNPELHAALIQNRRATCVERAALSGEERTIRFLPAGVLGTVAGYEASDHHSVTRAPYAERMIEVRTIAPHDLLEQNGAPRHIDYMSIDTEGSEFDIVSSLDHDRWRIALFTIEHNHVHAPRAAIRAFMEERDYRCVEAAHDDWFWHPDHLRLLNGDADVDYERICASFSRP